MTLLAYVCDNNCSGCELEGPCKAGALEDLPNFIASNRWAVVTIKYTSEGM